MSEYKVKIKQLPKSEIKIEAEIASSLFDASRDRALKKLGETVEIAGFRKGHVPEKVVLEKVGEARILEEAANILLNEYYPKIILEEKLDTIGRPEVAITKMAL